MYTLTQICLILQFCSCKVALRIFSTSVWPNKSLINDTAITTTIITTVTTTYTTTANKTKSLSYLTALGSVWVFSSQLFIWFPWRATDVSIKDIFIFFRLVKWLSLTKLNILTPDQLCSFYYITETLSYNFLAEANSKFENTKSILNIYSLQPKEAQRKGYRWNQQNPLISEVSKPRL